MCILNSKIISLSPNAAIWIGIKAHFHLAQKCQLELRESLIFWFAGQILKKKKLKERKLCQSVFFFSSYEMKCRFECSFGSDWTGSSTQSFMIISVAQI